MSGINLYSSLLEISRVMDTLTQRDEIETALDQVEYLFEVIPPELQYLAEPVIETLRKKLSDCT